MSDFPIKIILPIATTSPNVLLRMHYMKRRDLRNSIGWWLVAAGAKEKKYQAGWKARRSVEIISYRKKLLDPDNLVGSVKILLDAMQEVGLIFDDSTKYLSLTVSQELCKGDPWTEIIVDKLEDENE